MKTRQLVLTGFFTALIAVFSQIQIPLPMVPINLALIAIYLAGALLPFPYGFISVLAYLLLGLVGLPVFVGMRGGASALVGPTGGYLLGYLLCVLIVNLPFKKGSAPIWRLPLQCLIGTLLLYAFGTAWFMHLTNSSLSVSLGYCVFPFLLGDGVKIALSSVLAKRLSPLLNR